MSDSLACVHTSAAQDKLSDMLISLHNNLAYTQLGHIYIDKWNMHAEQFPDWRCEVGSTVSKPGKQSVTPSQAIHNIGLTATTNCDHTAGLSGWQVSFKSKAAAYLRVEDSGDAQHSRCKTDAACLPVQISGDL